MAEKPEKKEKAEKPEKAEKAEKPEKKDKGEKKVKKEKDTAASDAPAAAAPAAAPVAAPVERKNTPPRPRIPQLAKKNKSRLPRRQKKALQKAANKG
jgi:hypothetical protein